MRAASLRSVSLWTLRTDFNRLNHHSTFIFKPMRTTSLPTELSAPLWRRKRRLKLVSENYDPVRPAAWQQTLCCRHAHYTTASGVSSGRWRLRWWGSLLGSLDDLQWVHGSLRAENRGFHLSDRQAVSKHLSTSRDASDDFSSSLPSHIILATSRSLSLQIH